MRYLQALKNFNLFTFLFIPTFLLTCTNIGYAAVDEVYLIDILHGNTGGTGESPRRLWADSYGGGFEVTVDHGQGFQETVKVSWDFDKRDIRYLKIGDKFKANLYCRMQSEGREEDDPNMKSYGSRSSYTLVSHQSSSGSSALAGQLVKSGDLAIKDEQWNKSVFDGGRTTVVPRKYSSYDIGTSSSIYEVTQAIGKMGGYCYVSLRFAGYAYGDDLKKDCVYEIIYLYRTGGTPPKKSPVVSVGGAKPPKRPNEAPNYFPDYNNDSNDKDGKKNNDRGNKNQTDRNTKDDSKKDKKNGNKTNNNRDDDNKKRRTGDPDNTDVQTDSLPGPIQDREIFFPLPPPASVPLPDNIPANRRDELLLFAEKVRVRPGDTIRVPIILWNATDVSNMNFNVSTRSSVATPTGSVFQGALISQALFKNNTIDNENVLVGFAYDEGFAGNGTVAYVTYKAVGKPGDRTPVNLKVTTANSSGGSDLTVYTYSGEIQIVDEKDLFLGDCNGDGVINEPDAVCALEISVNLRPTQSNLDVDNNGEVTSRDATIILQNGRR